MTRFRAPGSVRWVGHGIRYRMGASETLYPLARRLYTDTARKPVSADADIVIEGFPRSANSFARRAFVHAQPAAVDVRGHTHFPIPVLRAVALDLPVIVLVREPRDAVLSFLVMAPHLTPRLLLHEYCRFYDTIEPALDRVVVATFEQATTDMGRVIRRVNDRFGTTFTLFEHDDTHEQDVFRLQESNYTRNVAQGRDIELGVARPSDRRRELKRRAAPRLDAPRVRNVLARARDTHERIAATAVEDDARCGGSGSPDRR